MIAESFDPKTEIENWQNASILSLWKHFHGTYPKRPFQTNDRAGFFYLDIKEDDRPKFEGLLDDLEEVSIHLALGELESDSMKMTFYPIISIKAKGKELVSFRFSPDNMRNIPSTRGGVTDENGNKNTVPSAFLDTVSSSWHRLAPTAIDDVFLAYIGENNRVNGPRLRRLTSFIFNEEKNKNIFNNFRKLTDRGRFKLERLGFHLGVDLNKVDFPDTYSFTPVLECRFKKITENSREDQASIKSHASVFLNRIYSEESHATDIDFKFFCGNDGDGSIVQTILFEYIQPCPPTCPPHLLIEINR